MQEYTEIFIRSFEYALLAWFISKLEPFQVFIEDSLSERGRLGSLFYTMLSCIYCLVFWITLTCMATGFDIPNYVSVACLASFVIKSAIQIWERD